MSRVSIALVEPSNGLDLSRTWALVPIRGLKSAKVRLRAELEPEERVALVTEMLRRTLVATRDAASVTGTVVVTMDAKAAAMARSHGAIGLVEHVPGLNEAIEAARSLAVARGATAVLVLPADVPAVTSGALDQLVGDVRRVLADSDPGSRPQGAVVAVVPDRHGEGTNALLVSPPAAIPPRFGEASRRAHREAAQAAAARYVEVGGPLTLDVDTPADLVVAEARLGPLEPAGRDR